MARIRSIKPDLRTSLTVAEWPREVRYLFVLLWGYLDDHGYGVDDARLIKADCLPLDEDVTRADVEDWLDLIATSGHADGSGPLCRYEVGGRRFLHCPNWDEHQRPSHPSPSKAPPCPHHDLTSDSGDAPENLAKTSPPPRRTGAEGRNGIAKRTGAADTRTEAARRPRKTNTTPASSQGPGNKDEIAGRDTSGASPEEFARTSRSTPETLVPETGDGDGRREKDNPASAPPPRAELVPVARVDVERICAHLADRIEGNGSRRPAITDRWRDAARLMLDADGRTEADVHAAIDWCQDSEFWRANVMSLPKLRERFDQLRLQAARGRPALDGSVVALRPSTTDVRVAQGLALAAKFAQLDALEGTA